MARRPVSLRDLQARADERNASAEYAHALVTLRVREYRTNPTPERHRAIGRAVRVALQRDAGR
jgi:hypothetical protein